MPTCVLCADRLLDLLGALLSGVKAPGAGDNFKLALFGEDDPGYSTSASKVRAQLKGAGCQRSQEAGERLTQYTPCKVGLERIAKIAARGRQGGNWERHSTLRCGGSKTPA